ncbi:MAG: DNA repair protein RecO, partial [Clostridia bacterium]|nr:DNA repair protein RecO [Clostridia bacterium]
YANFEFYRKGTVNILKGGSVNDSFYDLSRDIDRLNLAAYLCEVTCELTDEGEPAEAMLRLLLNSFYAIGHELYPQELIKGAFEMRAAAESGYEPDLACCSGCGLAEWEHGYLDVMNGALLCPACLQKRGREVKNTGVYDDLREAEVLCPVSAAVRAALDYCVHAPLGRLFSFELKDTEDLRTFAKTAQTYLLSHLGRGFDSLDFYNMMRDPKYSAKGT